MFIIEIGQHKYMSKGPPAIFSILNVDTALEVATIDVSCHCGENKVEISFFSIFLCIFFSV